MKRLFNTDIRFFKAVAVLVGTTVGAGIFGLPYAIAKVGLLAGIIYIIIIGLAVLGVNLAYGEVVIRTRGKHQMSGYAEKYLGSSGKWIIAASLILGIYGALLAYMIGVGNFLYDILGPTLGGSATIYSVIFWMLASLAVFRGLGMMASLELIMVEVAIFIIVFVSGVSLFNVNINNFFYSNIKEFFYPFGIVLFALGGATAIPTMKEILGHRYKELKLASIVGLIIPVAIYILFSIAVVGVSGTNTTEQALRGLVPYLGNWVVVLGGLFGIIAMSTSFMILSQILRETYVKDYDVPPILASFFVILAPLLIFLSGMNSFAQVVGISGSLLSGIQGILIILMYYRAKKMGKKFVFYNINIPLWLGFAMCLLFVLGIVYQVYYLF
ncbi:MAG: aromatic amino acid transport family protein [Patescibacteria group bacterium]